MERDREDLDFELMGENYFAALDARHEAEGADKGEDEDDPDCIRPETLARWAGERDERMRRESTAQILARAEMAAEFAELDAAELKDAA